MVCFIDCHTSRSGVAPMSATTTVTLRPTPLGHGGHSGHSGYTAYMATEEAGNLSNWHSPPASS